LPISRGLWHDGGNFHLEMDHHDFNYAPSDPDNGAKPCPPGGSRSHMGRSGGRYDNLIGLSAAQSLPATGATIGIEHLLVVMEEQGMFPPALGRLRTKGSSASP